MRKKRIINRAYPRLEVTVDWGTERPLGSITLFVARVGDPLEFAAYPPLDENGGLLLFQFDELLFVRPQGRYRGRLVVGVTEVAQLEFDYRDSVRVISVENANV